MNDGLPIGWQPPEFPGLEILRGSFGRHEFPRHFHDGLMIAVMGAGAQETRYKGASHVAGEGRVVAIAAGEVHSVRRRSADGWHYQVFTVPYRMISDRMLAPLQGFASDVVIDDPQLARQLRAAHTAFSSATTTLEREDLLFSALNTYFQRHVDPAPLPAPEFRDERAVRRAIEYLSEHPDRNVTLAELAAAAGTRHAVAVSSGTAAIHTAVAACGIGPGDEVLVPALTVIMVIAAVALAGAQPVLVDAGPGGEALDLEDLAAKVTPRTRAVIPVHFAGRTGNMDALAGLADEVDLTVIEDACQAQGSLYWGKAAGTWGRAGCFSLKDGKITSCGEGGYLLTDDSDIASAAAAFRNHGTPPGASPAARTSLGTNYRLAEPLAALARDSLARQADALAERRRQTSLLADLVGGTPGLEPVPPGPGDQPNGYAALWRVRLPDPRGFCEHLATCGVPNSIGSFGFRAASADPACAGLRLAACPRAEALADSLLAVPVTSRTADDRIAEMAAVIIAEGRRWASC